MSASFRTHITDQESLMIYNNSEINRKSNASNRSVLNKPRRRVKVDGRSVLMEMSRTKKNEKHFQDDVQKFT